MSSGIIYYNVQTKCMVRILVSLYSLRRSGYTGPVAVIYEEHIDRKQQARVLLADWFKREAIRLGAELVQIPHDQNVEYALTQKARLWRFTPYDCSLFIDADTLVCQDPGHLLRDIETGPGFAAVRFVSWVTTGAKVSRRIKAWECVVGPELTQAALDYGPAINTGTFGFRKGHPMLSHWERICVDGYEMQKTPPQCPGKRTLDEVAAQVLIPQYKTTLWDERWNWSIQYGLAKPDEVGICHYHGGKHLLQDPEHRPETHALCDKWREAYWELRNGSPEYEHYTEWDRNLVRYELPKQRDDLTILCATDAKYCNKLERHMAVWMQTPGLREQRYLVLCVSGIPYIGEFARLNRWTNVEQVYYAPPPGAERREAALSAFVFGAAQHVKTAYHMKLDGDSVVKGPFVWPDYAKHHITADPWGSTRNKGAPHLKRHFLNELDSWWQKRTGDKPMFDEIPVDQRFKHARFRSYCCIVETSCIRELAAMCNQRLPVPSHDGCLWYVGTRLGWKIKRHKFRAYINA